VTGTEIDASGNPLGGVQVIATLTPSVVVDEPGPDDVDPNLPLTTYSASNGTWSLSLERTDLMTPSGEVYMIQRFADGAFLPVAYITVPSGGGNYLSLLTSAP
jgi:hypothetical protein